jgi:hypothetical protein
VEIRGSAEGAEEGAVRYRKLALKEALICTLSTGALWLIPALFYAISLAMAGIGFGYGEAWGIEAFFVSFSGLCEPFRSPWVGLILGMGVLFASTILAVCVSTRDGRKIGFGSKREGKV